MYGVVVDVWLGEHYLMVCDIRSATILVLAKRETVVILPAQSSMSNYVVNMEGTISRCFYHTVILSR